MANSKPKKPKANDPGKAEAIPDQAVEIAEWVAKALAAAEELGIKKNPLEYFYLSPAQRDVLRLVPGLPNAIKRKLAKNDSSFTMVEVASLTMALAEELPESKDQRQVALLIVAQHLMERLQEGMVIPKPAKAQRKISEPKGKTSSPKVFQFKITLKGIEPPIWQRIQTGDCTLDKLHECIQTAMGWTNSHLHLFKIGGVIYGDPQLLYDSREDDKPPVNSLRTKLSKIVPKDGKRFTIQYEYDFGDCWEHEILFEGFPPPEKNVRYPLCVEGERACPPEDVGGVPGYEEYLEAMVNPKHKRHKELMGWRGPFDPEAFDAKAATKQMQKGLPDWRNAGPF
jgi:hypothetical protein